MSLPLINSINATRQNLHRTNRAGYANNQVSFKTVGADLAHKAITIISIPGNALSFGVSCLGYVYSGTIATFKVGYRMFSGKRSNIPTMYNIFRENKNSSIKNIIGNIQEIVSEILHKSANLAIRDEFKQGSGFKTLPGIEQLINIRKSLKENLNSPLKFIAHKILVVATIILDVVSAVISLTALNLCLAFLFLKSVVYFATGFKTQHGTGSGYFVKALTKSTVDPLLATYETGKDILLLSGKIAKYCGLEGVLNRMKDFFTAPCAWCQEELES